MQLAMDILQWIAIVLLSYNTHRFMRLQCKFNELQATQNHSVSDMIGGILKCFGTTKADTKPDARA